MASKRAAARAISEYAQQGRVYAPATSILFQYMEREGDPKTHCYLHAAIDRGLKVEPVALGSGARSEQGNALDRSSWTSLQSTERARLNTDSRPADLGDCSVVAEALPPVSQVQPRTSEFSQYLDVDCERANRNPNFQVALDSALAAQYKVESATAQIRNPANLKDASATIVKVAPDLVIVGYSIVGLDRQLFGNCPGGGHGTLVVTFNLAPK